MKSVCVDLILKLPNQRGSQGKNASIAAPTLVFK